MFDSPHIISRLVTEDKKELYAARNMQQNTILVTQFSNELYKIHSNDAGMSCGWTNCHRDTDDKHTTDF